MLLNVENVNSKWTLNDGFMSTGELSINFTPTNPIDFHNAIKSGILFGFS